MPTKNSGTERPYAPLLEPCTESNDYCQAVDALLSASLTLGDSI